MTHQPSYYGILPAHVRYDKSLSPMQRIMYAEITALSNKDGYCTSKNSYFADLYEVTTVTVSRWINGLEKAGHIQLRYGDQFGADRKIYPLNKNVKPPYQKDQAPLNKNVKQNNTSIILQENTTPDGAELANDSFEEFWENFDNKKEKKRAATAWKRLSKAKQRSAIDAIPAYKAYLIRTGYSQMYPTTWLNGERWTDDFTEPKPTAQVVSMPVDDQAAERRRKIREELARREAMSSAHG